MSSPGPEALYKLRAMSDKSREIKSVSKVVESPQPTTMPTRVSLTFTKLKSRPIPASLFSTPVINGASKNTTTPSSVQSTRGESSNGIVDYVKSLDTAGKAKLGVLGATTVGALVLFAANATSNNK